MQYIEKYILKEDRDSFLSYLRGQLVNKYDVNCDEFGELAEEDLCVSEDEISIKQCLEDEIYLNQYWVDNHDNNIVKVKFSQKK